MLTVSAVRGVTVLSVAYLRQRGLADLPIASVAARLPNPTELRAACQQNCSCCMPLLPCCAALCRRMSASWRPPTGRRGGAARLLMGLTASGRRCWSSSGQPSRCEGLGLLLLCMPTVA